MTREQEYENLNESEMMYLRRYTKLCRFRELAADTIFVSEAEKLLAEVKILDDIRRVHVESFYDVDLLNLNESMNRVVEEVEAEFQREEEKTKEVGEELAETLFDDQKAESVYEPELVKRWVIKTAGNCTCDNIRDDDVYFAKEAFESMGGEGEEEWELFWKNCKLSFLAQLQNLCRSKCEEEGWLY